MLIALWSPKGGSGTTVVAAACSLVLARTSGCRLADLGGDHAAVLGLPSDPSPGLAEWLAVAPDAPTEALERLAVEVAPRCTLVPRGAGDLPDDPAAGAALAVALRDGAVPTVLDAGSGTLPPAARAAVEVADASLVVVRGCYLALRRAAADPLVVRSAGVVLVHERGRSIGARDVAEVLGRPVLASVEARASVARAVDAGVLAARLPDSLARPLAAALGRIGAPARRGRAA